MGKRFASTKAKATNRKVNTIRITNSKMINNLIIGFVRKLFLNYFFYFF